MKSRRECEAKLEGRARQRLLIRFTLRPSLRSGRVPRGVMDVGCRTAKVEADRPVALITEPTSYLN
jgi:hypothetical protein